MLSKIGLIGLPLTNLNQEGLTCKTKFRVKD